MNKKELGIYIHIPFCKSKCYYCDFISYPNKINLAKDYINALKKEISQFDFANYDVTTIYIGGGTPSYINENEISEILEIIKNKIKGNKTKFKDIEITIEVNPGTVTLEKLKTYKKAGINRLSIGLQSTEDRLLKEIGRIHSYSEFLDTYKTAEAVGFNNINVDLMIALPNQTIKDIIKLNPNHISVYSLIIEEGTVIEQKLNQGKITLPEDEEERRMYWFVKNFLELNGYKHYEISNFAKSGYESKHNLNCWNQEEYIGFGISAHSYLNNIRFGNQEDLEQYIKNINENKLQENIKIEEKQTKEEQEKEFMMLGFRKIEGVNIAKFKEKFIENPLFLYNKELERLANQGLIEVDLNYIRLTNKGLDLANMVFEEFV